MPARRGKEPVPIGLIRAAYGVGEYMRRLRDGRLHDARHTAATVLLVLEVPERTVMAIMGWSSTSMAAATST